jgi:hypothetical protein
MSLWGDITKAINNLPGAGEVNKLGSDVAGAVEGIPTVAKSLAGQADWTHGLGQVVNGGGNSTTSTSNPSDAQTQQLLGLIAGLSYGQTQGSGAAALAKQLSTQLQSLPAGDATKVLAALNKEDPGSTLASDISGDVTPASTTATSPYGNDPLDLGQLFTQTLAPWLASQQKMSDAETNSLTSQMQSQLKNASPALQQAFSLDIPAMKETNQQMNTATAEQVATAPEWDNLIQQLTNQTNAYKLAQAAAANEPYVAATTQGTALPNTGVYSTANSTLNSIMQGILNPAATATTP